MLTELRIQNFKAWKDTGLVKLAPLTVIFGTNSSGKSSLAHLLLALKQTVLLSDRKRSLHLGDENSLVDLGTFSDSLYAHNPNLALEFSLRWKLTKPINIKNIMDAAGRDSFSGDELKLLAKIKMDSKQQPKTDNIQYELFSTNQIEPVMNVTHGYELHNEKNITLEVEPLKLVKTQGRQWPAEPPEKFYRFADQTLLRYQNASFLSELSLATEQMLDKVYFLGPLREKPKRSYLWSGDTPSDVGMSGERAVAAILAAKEQGRQINNRYRARYKKFDVLIAEWLVALGVVSGFTVKQVSKDRKEYEVMVKTSSKLPEVKLTDVGFGVSQVLPALVQAFYPESNSTVWMEQPEIHLHPAAQANLADAFISAVDAGEYGQEGRKHTQLIIETHSEHFLNRLQRRIAEEKISHKDVAIYFVTQSSDGAQLKPLDLDLYGEIKNWPPNFFGNEMEDITERALAKIKRIQEERQL